MLLYRSIITAIFALFLTACSTVRFSSDGTVAPLMDQGLPPQSKILVVSAVNDNFTMGNMFSSGNVHVMGGNIDSTLLQTTAQTIKSIGPYTVQTVAMNSNHTDNAESGGSMFTRTFTQSITQSMASGSMSLQPEVLAQLNRINASYHANYIF